MDLYSLMWSTQSIRFHLTHIQLIISIVLSVMCLGIIVTTMFYLIRERIVARE